MSSAKAPLALSSNQYIMPALPRRPWRPLPVGLIELDFRWVNVASEADPVWMLAEEWALVRQVLEERKNIPLPG